MSSLRHRRNRAEKGASMVEFALVAPAYMMLVYGLVLLSFIVAGYCSAAYAAQIGVRYAIVRGGDNTLGTVCTAANITNLLTPYLWAAPKNGFTVTTTWTPDNNTGSTVKITVLITYNTAIPFAAARTVTVGSTAQGTILY